MAAAIGGGAAHRLVERAVASGTTLATAESLTAGLVCASLADVPGASAVLRGGVVAYASDLKTALLGVDPELIARLGPVHEDVAAQMAVGVRHLLGSGLGLSTTGVAGPGPQDGVAAGTALVAVADANGVRVQRLALDGDRPQVRRATVEALLELALGHLNG